MESASRAYGVEIMFSIGNAGFGEKHEGPRGPRGGWLRMRCCIGCEGMTLRTCQKPTKSLNAGEGE